jgi:hypothetical protein
MSVVRLLETTINYIVLFPGEEQEFWVDLSSALAFPVGKQYHPLSKTNGTP